MLDDLDPLLHDQYLLQCSAFKSKATIYGTLSTMRCFGESLLREGAWSQNPLRWMKGPKVTPYQRLPPRIDHAHMEAFWCAAADRRGEYSRRLWIAVLMLLYGTGLRRGELERLDVEQFDRTECTLRLDGRKTRRERMVPVSEAVYRCLEAYWPLRHNQLERMGAVHEPALLVSQRGERLSAQAISNGIHALARKLPRGEILHRLRAQPDRKLRRSPSEAVGAEREARTGAHNGISGDRAGY